MTRYFSEKELVGLGFAKVGRNCQISRKVSFYGISGSIGDNVRIDDFSILKGQIFLGDYVHINAQNMISGAHGQVWFKGCIGTSVGVSIYTGSDDHRANTLNNPTVPSEYSAQINGPVTVGFGAVIGSHATILPNVSIGDAAAIGAHSVVHFNVPPGGIVRPAQTVLLERRRDVQAIKRLCCQLLENHDGEP